MATTATMSGLQFDALPYEEGRRWELLEGEPIEVSSPTPRHQMIVSRLLRVLQAFMESTGNKGLVLPDVEFALSDNLRLRPDICVLLPEKAAQLDVDRIPIPVAPDLAIQVISPTERTSDSRAKVRAYLDNGTPEVWQLYPKSRELEIYRTGSASILDGTQQITSDLLPGFSAPVEYFFGLPS